MPTNEKKQFLTDLALSKTIAQRQIAFQHYLTDTYPQLREVCLDNIRVAEQALEALDAKHKAIPEKLLELERGLKRTAKKRTELMGIGAKKRELLRLKMKIDKLQQEVDSCS